MKACGLCGNEFAPIRVTHQFCSIQCQRRARGAQLRRPDWSSRDCAFCGNTFEWTPGGSHHRRYCSMDCKRQFATRVNSGVRWRHVARRYGLAPAVFDAMLAGQDGGCSICCRPLTGKGLEPGSPQVDHDHATGTLRAILCRPCNTALGMFRDDPVLVEAAAKYLRGWGATGVEQTD